MAQNTTSDATQFRPLHGPTVYVLLLIVFLAAIALGVFLLGGTLLNIFLSNPIINGVILGVTIFGSLFLVMQTQSLGREVKWYNYAMKQVELFNQGNKGIRISSRKPALLSPLHSAISDTLDESKEFHLTATSYTTVVDVVGNRVDERRDVSRYMVGVLVFLGLLGTFWGLLGAIAGIAGAIGTLSADNSDALSFISIFVERLKQPISSMSTAFSSSLFGLAGSMIVGFVELISGQAHNRFLTDLEDSLASFTHMSEEQGVAPAAGGSARSIGVSANLADTNSTLDRLVKTLQRSEQSRLVMDSNLEEFIAKLGQAQQQHATVERLSQQIAQLQELAYPVIVDTHTNLKTLVSSPAMNELNKRLDYIGSVMEAQSKTDSPDFLARIDRLTAALEKGQGAASGGSAGSDKQVAELNQQITALRQELAAGRQALGQQLLGLSDAVRKTKS